MKILIIDDCEQIREILCDLFEDEGFQVLASENGLHGVEQALKHLPDLIVSDINMPELDGHGVLSQLQQNPSTDNIPFIFLTANADAKTRDLSLEMGANAYLTKPVASRDLMEMVSFFLKVPLSYLNAATKQPVAASV